MNDSSRSIAILRAAQALTHGESEQRGPTDRDEDGWLHKEAPHGGQGATLPLLERSIARDLRKIEEAIGGRGRTTLFVIAASIDDALLALQEALSYGEVWGDNDQPENI